jgi:signal transduction histidine kinase
MTAFSHGGDETGRDAEPRLVSIKGKPHFRAALADRLHATLGQHLAGTLLTAGALAARLTERHAPEACEAAYLVDILREANEEFTCLILTLDKGKPR